MHRLAVLLLLTCSAFAAEVPVSDVVLGDPNAYSGPPAIATDGDGFLVVWSDGRVVGVKSARRLGVKGAGRWCEERLSSGVKGARRLRDDGAQLPTTDVLGE